MKIGIIASHAWPLPSPARTGDSQIILDLTRTLAEMGHEVYLYAPAGTKAAEGVEVRPMPLSSMGQAEPSTDRCEQAFLDEYAIELAMLDVVHDCSVGKAAGEWCLRRMPTIGTQWGGVPGHRMKRNLVAQSHAQAARLAKGLDDYNTPGGPCVDTQVVWNGIDTDAYKPTGKGKQDFFLMFGRWHPVRGIVQAIELAKATGINLLIAGEDPERDHPYQADYARQMCELARGCDNISIEFLPDDPDHHTRKVELYSDARALLFLPQFEEPFGLPQIEAMSCGTPVLAEARGSVFEVVGETFSSLRGFLKLPKHQRIELMGSDWDGYNEWPRKRAVELFDRRVMAANYLKLYEEVAGGGGWG